MKGKRLIFVAPTASYLGLTATHTRLSVPVFRTRMVSDQTMKDLVGPTCKAACSCRQHA